MSLKSANALSVNAFFGFLCKSIKSNWNNWSICCLLIFCGDNLCNATLGLEGDPLNWAILYLYEETSLSSFDFSNFSNRRWSVLFQKFCVRFHLSVYQGGQGPLIPFRQRQPWVSWWRCLFLCVSFLHVRPVLFSIYWSFLSDQLSKPRCWMQSFGILDK